MYICVHTHIYENNIYIPTYDICMCVYVKSLLLPSCIQIYEQNPARMGCWPRQDLCYIELDSMMIAVKIGFCLYLILLQKRKYLVSGRYLVVTAGNIRKE